jgi:limonene-1,2-epoxide hydrolase
MENLCGRPSRAAWRVLVPVLALGAFLVAAVGVAAQAAQATDPLAVLQRFVAARNAGDVAGAMALVADDIRFVGGPVCTPEQPCLGRDVAQRDVVEQFISTFHAHLTIIGTPQVTGNQVLIRTEVTDDRSRAAGVDRLVANLTVEVRDGKIVRWVSLPDASDPQTATFLASPPAQPAAPPAQLPRTGAGGGTAGWPGPAAGGALGVVLLAGLGARRLVARRR